MSGERASGESHDDATRREAAHAVAAHDVAAHVDGGPNDGARSDAAAGRAAARGAAIARSSERIESALQAIVGAAHVHTHELIAHAAGGAPRAVPLACPANAAEVQACVRHALAERLALLPCGLLSKHGWARAPERVDFLLSTRRLRNVVNYEPGDGTIRVESGITLAELARTVELGGHWSTPELPRPGGATLGGAIGAGASGFDRLRFGPLRHHVLGLRVVDGFGELTKSGGQLVKNVTGFDLHRLYTGSHGSLCVIVEASLRLFALPEHWIALAWEPRPLEHALDAARAALATAARPYTLLLREHAGARFELCVRLAGRAGAIEAEHRALNAALGAPASVERDHAAIERAAAWRDEQLACERWPELVVECAPTALAAALAALRSTCEAHGVRARLAIHPGLARVECRLTEPADAESLASSALTKLREALVPVLRDARAHARWQRVPDELRRGATSSGFELASTQTPGFELMRRLKAQLDPERVFAPGRLHPLL